MPVNTAGLKTFAPAMRRQLLEAVGRKLDLLLHSQTPDTLSTYATQIAELREQEAENREQLLEQVAYTWFNRFSALRYLDARGWHPFGCKVLMPAGEDETQPELLKLMRTGSLPAELKQHTNEARLHGLLDGQIPTAIPGADSQGEVYRELVLASCRSYHHLLPNLFEKLDDATELLLPDDLLTEGSIAGGFRRNIEDKDCLDVEVIGWLYQFYISEEHARVIGKLVSTENIPAATQLFTPNWVVKYLVQNSIGARWIALNPESQLQEKMEYFMHPSQGAEHGETSSTNSSPEWRKPEDIKIIDPACGSGHILVEAYELLKAIYLEKGYQLREVPRLILENNLFGVDICPRAVQLTCFALLMKGRADNRRLLDQAIDLNIESIRSVEAAPFEGARTSLIDKIPKVTLDDIQRLVNIFSNGASIGALIQIPHDIADGLSETIKVAQERSSDIFIDNALKNIRSISRKSFILAQKYDFVIANPPYMGGRFINPQVKQFAEKHYPDSIGDSFACFIERGLLMLKPNGLCSMVTMESWMFLPTFESLRKKILSHCGITNILQIEGGIVCGFGTSASIISRNKNDSDEGSYTYAKKTDLDSMTSVPPHLLLARSVLLNQDVFADIPGSPIAFRASKRIRDIYKHSQPLGQEMPVKTGLQTGDNNKFLRFWAEVSFSRIGLNHSSRSSALESSRKWFPYNKGGGYRKWYGNNEFVVNWHKDGQEIRSFGTENGGRPRSRAQNADYYFKRSVSWSFIGQSLAARYSPPGSIFDVGGSSVFPSEDDSFWVNGLMCSKPTGEFMRALNPTLNYQVGNIASIPIMMGKLAPFKSSINDAVKRIVAIAKKDWDSHEVSWDFEVNPLLGVAEKQNDNLRLRFDSLLRLNEKSLLEATTTEQQINRLFIDVYELAGEMAPDLKDEEITLSTNLSYLYGSEIDLEVKASRYRRDVLAEFISYIIGCMMGRYCFESPGLILADSRDSQASHLAAYEERLDMPITEARFKPDLDGIIPVLDGEWFEDDIVARTREFLEVTFPESTVTENLRFIEESLGKDIRKYFCSDFYKDHLQTYKRRPIYWMVQSPKKGFACLIYLHRYTKDSLNQVLNNYFRPYLQKLEARLAQLGLEQLNDDLPTRERTAARKEAEKITKVLKECQTWEQDALLPLAQQRIELDLDDGVKVNYLKLQDVLAPIPGLAAKED
jgi:hypothetical protein